MRGLILAYGASLGVTLALVALFLAFGPPSGQSMPFNVVWAKAFAAQFQAGDLYPRWLFGLNQGAGGPEFFFYGPFAFWLIALSDVLFCAACSAMASYIVGLTLLIGLSGVAFYAWGRLHAAPTAAAAATIFYLLAPYHLSIDFWYRASAGEVAAYVWMPLILLGLARAPASRAYLVGAAVSYAGLIYSHLPSALLFTLVMVLYAPLSHGLRRGLGILALTLALGLGLSGLYLLPALLLQGDINASAWWNDPHYNPRNWLWFEGRMPVSAFANLVLPALLMPTLLAVWLTPLLWFGVGGRSRLAAFLALSVVAAWFFMSSPSELFWDDLPLLRDVQFPWRLGTVLDVAAASMLGLACERARQRPALLVATGVVTVVLLGAYYVVNVPHMAALLWRNEDADWVAETSARIAAGASTREYETAWLLRAADRPGHKALPAALAAVPTVTVIAGQGRAEVASERAEKLTLRVEAKTALRLRLRRFYFPGWRLRDQTGRSFAVQPGSILGLLEVEVPAGSYRLKLERRTLKPERIGGAISAASLLLCLLLILGPTLRRRLSRGG